MSTSPAETTDENTSILGHSMPTNAIMVQAVLFLGFLIEHIIGGAWPASFKVLEEQLGFSMQDLALIHSYEKILVAVSLVFWGVVSDKMPKYIIMAWTAASLTLVSVCMAGVQTFWQLSAIRLLHALLGGSLGPLSAIIIPSVVARENRAKSFAFIPLCGNMGTIIGQTILMSTQHMTGPFGIQGWRICFLGSAVLGAIFTVITVAIAMADQDPPLSNSRIVSSDNVADVVKVMSTPSVAIMCVQGIFRSSSVQVLGFTTMWIQYQGFDDQTAAWINNSRLVGWMLGGVLAGLIADSVAKSKGDCSRIAFGQVGDVLRILFAVLSFGLIPAMLGSATSRELPTVVTLFLFGVAQPLAYIGMVRPMIAEIVSPSLWGLSFSVISIFDRVSGALVSGPIFAHMATIFGYTHVDGIHQMDAASQATNGAALGKSILWTLTTCQVLMLAAVGMLYYTYEKDRTAAQCAKLSEIK